MRPNPQFPSDLVAFIEEILNVKLHFLYNDLYAICMTKKNMLYTQELSSKH